MKPVGVVLTACCIAALAIWPLAAQEARSLLLTEVIARTQTRLEWDPMRGHGALVRGSDSVAFIVDLGVAAVNATTVFTIEPPRREGAAIRFGPTFVARALEVFPPREQLRRIAAIFIDPGHGGRDPGAVGSHGEFQLEEKAVVLAIGLRLRSLLRQRYPDTYVTLSRDTDRYLTLEERTRLANAIESQPNEAVIFVSLHANASLNRDARGFEVWFLPPTYRRTGLVAPDQVGTDDPDLLQILNTMREEEITLESVLLARNVLAGMESAIGAASPNRGLREESWHVVRNARMPSILVEVGFVTNVSEARLLRDDAHLNLLSGGIYNGIANFVDSFERMGQ